MNLLECKDIAFYAKDRAILKDINFKLNYKENMVVYSGVKTGSTLFLKIIDSMIDDVYGELIFEGDNVLNFSKEKKIEYSYFVSFVYEESGLLHSLNILDNILFPLKKYHKYDNILLENLINDFKLERILYKEPSEISDIETRLVNIVRAIIVKPKLILYDEMDGGMDIEMVSRIINLLEKYQDILGFAQIFTTVKNYGYKPYLKYKKSFSLFNGRLEKIDEQNHRV